MSFLNSAMVAASQRFLSYELGRVGHTRLKKVFSTSLLIHALIAGIMLLLAETIGLWFVNDHLNIASDRMFAANAVYQTSIILFCITIITVPFHSCLIAYERMDMFAYMGILESLFKLGVAYLVGVTIFDKLIYYGVLLLIVSVIISSLYVYYCYSNFPQIRGVDLDRGMFREMFAFAGWNLFGNIGSSFKEQVINILLNIFYGVKVNAARAIALQVNGMVSTLASNVSMSINPQITKQYASGNIEQSKMLVFACARYSFYLLLFITVPLLLNLDQVLALWLVDVPQYASQFFVVAIVVSLIYTLTGPVTTAIQATGRVRIFQIGVCVIMLLEIPLTYLLLELKYSPVISIIPSLLTNVIALVFRYSLLSRYVNFYTWKEYTNKVLLRPFFVSLLAFGVSSFVHFFLPNNLVGAILSVVQSGLVVIVAVYVVGINSREREMVIGLIKNR